MDGWEAARNALECALEAKKGENITIFCNREKMDVGKAFGNGASKLDLQTRLVQLKTGAEILRKEVPPRVVAILTEEIPDIYFNLLRGIREETEFRIKLIEMETKERNARLGHCPGVTLDMLTNGAFQNL